MSFWNKETRLLFECGEAIGLMDRMASTVEQLLRDLPAELTGLDVSEIVPLRQSLEVAQGWIEMMRAPEKMKIAAMRVGVTEEEWEAFLEMRAEVMK